MKCTDTNTTVKERSAQISVIEVNGETMTPVMFRQLPKRRLLRGLNAEMNGVAWGRVNYYWGACHRDHLHIVWVDREGTLLRDCVWPTPGPDAEATEAWKRAVMRLSELPQLYIDGKHEEGLVR